MMTPSMKVTVLVRSLLLLSLPLATAGLASGTIGRGFEVKPKPIKVTGCLAKGGAMKEFSITATGGKKYEVTSKSLDLAPHIGHTVTVKGWLVDDEKGETKAMEQKEEKSGEEKNEMHEAGRVEADSLMMVSPKCK